MPAYRYYPSPNYTNTQSVPGFDTGVNVIKNYSPKYLGKSKMYVYGAGYAWSAVILAKLTQYPALPGDNNIYPPFLDPSDLNSYVSFMEFYADPLRFENSNIWYGRFSFYPVDKIGDVSLSVATDNSEVLMRQINLEKYQVIIQDAKKKYTLDFSKNMNGSVNDFVNSVQLENQSGKFDLNTAQNILQDIANLISLTDSANPNQSLLSSARSNWESFQSSVIQIAKTAGQSSGASPAKTSTASVNKAKKNIPASSGPNGVSPTSSAGNDALVFDDQAINATNDPSTQTNTFKSTEFNQIASLLDIIRQETVRSTKSGDDDIITFQTPQQTVDSQGTTVVDSSSVEPCSEKSLTILMSTLTPAQRNSLRLALDYQLRLEQFKLDKLTLQLNKSLKWPEFDLAAFGAGIESAYTTGVQKGKEELDALLKGFQTSKKSFGNIFSGGLTSLKSIEFKLPDFDFSIPPVEFKIDSKILIDAVKARYGQDVADAVQCNLNKLTDANNKSNAPETVAQITSQNAEVARQVTKLDSQKQDAQNKVDEKKSMIDAVIKAEEALNAKLPRQDKR